MSKTSHATAVLTPATPFPADPPVLLTIKHVAAKLCMCERTVTSLIATGDLKSVKVGRSRRIRATDFAMYIARLG